MSGWFQTRLTLPNKILVSSLKSGLISKQARHIKQTNRCRLWRHKTSACIMKNTARDAAATPVSHLCVCFLRNDSEIQKKKKKNWIIQHLHGGRSQPEWRNESFKNYTRRCRSDCHYPLRGYWNVRQHSRLVRELAGGNARGLVCIPLKLLTPFLLFHSGKK